jgi:Mn2+/Fe2+ NRAMP family transporter
VVALTWLGAGDLVDSAVSGGSYGYALMWAMAVVLLARFFLVSIIAKFQLCNERGETVMAGLKRLHWGLPVFVGIATVFFSHFHNSYLILGLGEATQHLLNGFGPHWFWSIMWVVVAVGLVFGGGYRRIEKVFYVLLAMLSVSLIGIAVWSRPDPMGIFKGIVFFDIPEKSGAFGPLLVVVSLMGAIIHSTNNLMYPYFIREKGWIGPQYRKAQLYDLLIGIIIIIVLDLAVWVVGAEVLHPRNISIETIEDLAKLLTEVMGRYGAPIFYVGVLATLFTSIVGATLGYGYMCSDIVQKFRSDRGGTLGRKQASKTMTFKIIAVWALVSPLIWSIPGMPGFITLTIMVNAAAVIALPVVSLALWIITAKASFIGPKYKNRWWENLFMACLFVLSIGMTYQSARSLVAQIKDMISVG